VWTLTLAAALATDVAIVPGCPSDADGRVSDCQWRRAVWAAKRYHEGAFQWIVPSGSAVHNAYVEADAIALALVQLGVPAAAIVPERNAMHTDQNVAWSLSLIEAHGWSTVVVASDGRQPDYGCKLVNHWTTLPCEVSSIDYPSISPWLQMGPPPLYTDPVPGWEPLGRRERNIAAATGRPVRPPSWVVYSLQAVFEAARARPADLPAALSTPPSGAAAATSRAGR